MNTHKFIKALFSMPRMSLSNAPCNLHPTKIDIPVPTRSNKKSSAKYFIASKVLSRAPIATSFQTLCPATLTRDRPKHTAIMMDVAFTLVIENFCDRKATLGSRIEIIELNAATASKK